MRASTSYEGREVVLLRYTASVSISYGVTYAELYTQPTGSSGFYLAMQGTQHLVSGSGLHLKDQAPQNPASGCINHLQC